MACPRAVPTPGVLQLEQQLDAQFNGKLSEFNALLAGDVAAYNRAAYAAGAPTVMSRASEQVAAAP